jgi:hypothetical protein
LAVFDIEHTFRLFKQTLGWTCPKIRTPQAADPPTRRNPANQAQDGHPAAATPNPPHATTCTS